MISREVVASVVEEAQKPIDREAMMAQARKFLYDNQECYVAQWVLQNPFADINSYRLKFVYTDTSLLGYTVEMEKIENG